MQIYVRTVFTDVNGRICILHVLCMKCMSMCMNSLKLSHFDRNFIVVGGSTLKVVE
jgi:dissimilatory sulfite reductase (desulfoviridin) alpha/beta subunit